MYSKIYFSTLGLVEIIDIPLILTVMLCSDSEVTCGWGGGGQFYTFKSRPYHTRNPLHSVHRSHAYVPCTFEGRAPMWRTKKFPEKSLGGLIFKHMYDMFTRESDSMHTPFSVTMFYFYICNLIGPFTYAKAT